MEQGYFWGRNPILKTYTQVSEECLRETIVSMAKGQRKGPEIIKMMSKFEALREGKREVILSVWGRRKSIF